jgi:UDP-glucose 4-epimerase
MAYVTLASSSSVYGANPTVLRRETLLAMPMSPYAVSKLAAEQYAMAYAQCYGLSILPFRFFNVFGPGQLPGHVYAAVIPVFVEAALRGESLPIDGDGEQSRDFTYVGTVAETLAAAVKGRVESTPTNLAFGTRTTLNELIRMLEKELGHEIDVVHRAPRPGDVRHSQADSKLLKEVFGQIEPVPLEDGLRETVAWARAWVSRQPATATDSLGHGL